MARLPNDGGDGAHPDCRLEGEADNPACDHLPDVTKGSLGDGPTFPGAVDIAFVDGDTVYVGYDGSSEGALFSVDLRTGTRALVTGSYEDPATGMVMAGEGPAVDGFVDAAMGDGLIYLHTGTAILGVDLTTGDRSPIIDNTTLCTVGATSEQISAMLYGGISLASDGTLYIARRSQVLLAVSGTTCQVVSSADADPLLGSGPTVSGEYADLVALGDVVYALTDFGRVLRIDPATGDWTQFSSVDVGEGPDPGDDYLDLSLDAQSLIPGGGLFGGLAVLVDLETGDRTEVPEPEIVRTVSFVNRAVPWAGEPEIWVYAEQAVELIDPVTGNMVRLSY